MYHCGISSPSAKCMQLLNAVLTRVSRGCLEPRCVAKGNHRWSDGLMWTSDACPWLFSPFGWSVSHHPIHEMFFLRLFLPISSRCMSPHRHFVWQSCGFKPPCNGIVVCICQQLKEMLALLRVLNFPQAISAQHATSRYQLMLQKRNRRHCIGISVPKIYQTTCYPSKAMLKTYENLGFPWHPTGQQLARNAFIHSWPNPAPACNASIKSEWEPSKFLAMSQRISPEFPNEIHKQRWEDGTTQRIWTCWKGSSQRDRWCWKP